MGVYIKRGRAKHISEAHKKKISIALMGRKVSTETSRKISLAKMGKPSPQKGKKLSAEIKERMRLAQLGVKNAGWKDEKAGYSAKHKWLYSRYGKANRCDNINCFGRSKTYQWANKTKQYKRDISDWMQLCKSCHTKYDLNRPDDFVFASSY